MSKYSKKDILRLVEEEDVEFIRLQFTDIFGILKNVAITSSQLGKALENKYMFDGSAVEGFAHLEEADMYLYPDLDTFEIFPWRPQQGKVARLICDVYRPDRTPFKADPRYVLKNVLEEAKELGYEFKVGPECEFFLFHVDDMGQPTTQSHEKAGYFDIGPVDLGENARRDIVLTLEEMGFEVVASHHEAASAQHEIDFKYEEALHTADNIMTFKLAVKTVARRHGLHATFMPKPKHGENGSGMHTNFSLFKDGINIFNDEKDENGLSQEAYYFIGGIMKHIKAITAITNSNINSYKRLVSGFVAPLYINWSTGNKCPLIRVPRAEGAERRIELRSPDPAANPYLVLAVCLAAGMDGIKKQIMPPKKIDESMANLSLQDIKEHNIERLPVNLYEAIDELKKSSFIQTVLGEAITDTYIYAKEQEWEEYIAQVSAWEIDRYLHKI
jgi:glutamine synthetase, type I